MVKMKRSRLAPTLTTHTAFLEFELPGFTLGLCGVFPSTTLARVELQFVQAAQHEKTYTKSEWSAKYVIAKEAWEPVLLKAMPPQSNIM